MLSYLESLIAVFGHSFGGQSSTVSRPDEKKNTSCNVNKRRIYGAVFQHIIFSELCGYLLKLKHMFGYSSTLSLSSPLTQGIKSEDQSCFVAVGIGFNTLPC